MRRRRSCSEPRPWRARSTLSGSTKSCAARAYLSHCSTVDMPRAPHPPFARPLPNHPAAQYASLAAAEAAGGFQLDTLPFSLRALADNVLRTAPEDQALDQLAALVRR